MSKTYKFIVINKSNMTELFHSNSPESVADKIFNFNKVFKLENWVIVKNETKVVKLNPSGGDGISVYRSVIRDLIDN